MRKFVARVAFAAALAAASGAARAEIIDRILAVVDGTIIRRSDVLIAMRLGPRPSAGAPDSLAAALDAQIERLLMLTEVERYAPAEPTEDRIDAGVAAVRKRVGSDTAFQALLDQLGFTLDDFQRMVRDDIWLETYLQQRFGAGGEPSEEEILAYFQAHQADFSRGGAPRTFADAHDTARAALIEERRRDLIRAWVAGLRRRADITILLNER